MREDIAGPQGASSRPMWETLEGMVREKAQEFIQQRSSPDLCVKAEEAPRLRLGCLGDLLFLEE